MRQSGQPPAPCVSTNSSTACDHSVQVKDSSVRFAEVIGSTPRMREIFAVIQRVPKTDATVLIEGERGTGEELVARGVHSRSRHRGNVSQAAHELKVSRPTLHGLLARDQRQGLSVPFGLPPVGKRSDLRPKADRPAVKFHGTS